MIKSRRTSSLHQEMMVNLAEKCLRDEFEGKNIGGLSAAVQYCDQCSEFSFGYANLENKEAVTPETQYFIGSITKAFVAICALQLFENGDLNLDDPITKFFDNAPDTWKKISIHNLLNHTAGLYDYAAGAVGTAHGFREYSLAETVALFESKELEFKPGKRFNYSNANYALLGTVIEKITQSSLEFNLRERIFSPLELNHTFYNCIPRSLATGYEKKNGKISPAQLWHPSFAGPAGGISSTVRDLSNWLHALFHEKLIPDHLVERMVSPVRLTNGLKPILLPGHQYGYGMAVWKQPCGIIYHHGGRYPYGFSSWAAYAPKNKLSIILLCNSLTDQTYLMGIGKKIFAVLDRAINS
jgi:CubicO group peptidase (beta-lactamase class C family)